MYSLANVATLVRDLARHPQGRALTDELIRAFALTSSDIDVLDRSNVVARVRRRSLVGVGHGGTDPLTNTTIGDADAFVRFVRHDVLAGLWCGTGELAIALHPVALDVISDGLLARWIDDSEGAGAWREWLAATSAVAVDDLPLVVDLVRDLRPAVAIPPSATWATHMHDACWAAYLTGRERFAARAQLHALRNLFAVVPAPAPRLVATVTAAVHAAVVADVLDTQLYAAMSEPFLRLLP